MCARNLRASLESLSAHSCGLKSLEDILICDNVHKKIDGKVSCVLHSDGLPFCFVVLSRFC